MHQIRGRVGRSSRRAFAYFTYTRGRELTDIATKRLEAIREYTEFGSGFKIAMRDLEIRGAGNLLGMSQHGHMEAVGYDLYCKMLNEAVQNLKGIHTTVDFTTVIDLDVDAYIPAEYIVNETQKLDIYKRISAIETEDEYMDMQDELLDRFGDIPKSVENLLVIARVRALAHKCYVTEVLVKEKEEDLLVPSQLCIIRPDKNKINSRFLKWYLESQQGKAQIATEQIGSSIQKISIASLKKIEIPEIDIDKKFFFY